MIKNIDEDPHYRDVEEEVMDELAAKIKASTDAAIGPRGTSTREPKPTTEEYASAAQVTRDIKAGLRSNIVSREEWDISAKIDRYERQVANDLSLRYQRSILAPKYERGERRFVRARPRRLVGLPEAEDSSKQSSSEEFFFVGNSGGRTRALPEV